MGKDGIDIRGDGGMVVLPPSATTKGRYTWISKGRPGGFPVAFLARKEAKTVSINDEPSNRGDPNWVLNALQGVRKPGRNDMCARLSGYFANKGLPFHIILSVLNDWNKKNYPPLPSSEVQRTVESMFHVKQIE